MSNFKTLLAWTVAMELVQAVYQKSKTLPKEEIFGLTSQLKRAAVSIPTNVAEGLGRKHRKDSAHFFAIARGSGYEVETLVSIASTNRWFSADGMKELEELLSRTLQLINGLIRRFEDPELK